MGAFICQISETDWLVSRKIGVYGNREGSERNGKVTYFAKKKRGEVTIQSIIEDLVGMRKGDSVFFHVIGKARGESSIHGVYRVRQEPFYNDALKLWESSSYFVYPYRFCFEPHPQHIELCKYDANTLVSEFYKSVESRNIRSVLTLEREVRGAAHAVKKISSHDAEEILKLLYRDFHCSRLEDPIDFEPLELEGPSLRNHIRRIGEIEFAIKALVAYELGRRDPDFVKYIPACRNAEYDFLIESFVGQTARKPTDIVCISSRDPEKAVTVLEAKTDLVQMDDFVQSLKYQELFKLRNVDKGSLAYETSICLLGQRFHQELLNYVSIRNNVLPWEEVVLLKYTPTQSGHSATFASESLAKPFLPQKSKAYPRIDIQHLRSRMHSATTGLCSMLGMTLLPGMDLELQSAKEDVHILARHYRRSGQEFLLGHVLIYQVDGTCGLDDLTTFVKHVHGEAEKLQGSLMAVEPIIVAKKYDTAVTLFIEKHNQYETRAGRRAISTYVSSGT